LGPVGLVALVAVFGDAPGVLDAARAPGGARAIAEALGRRSGDPVVTGARVTAAALAADGILERIRRQTLIVLTLDDAEYPPLLALTELPPPVLFVRGATSILAAGRAVAVVGTRRPTDAGRATAGRIAGAIARQGATVVSGLAVGIDGVAHAAAVGVAGLTIAVVGGGHDVATPRAHRDLADRIVASGGAIVSEHAPGTQPTRGTFPRRNRVISGLAEATVVVEAGRRSGALITAGWALEQGRECYLVPGPIGAAESAGCLAYLRAYSGQARIVAGIPELLEDLGLVDLHPSGAGPVANGRENARQSGDRATGASSSSSRRPGPEAMLADLPGPVATVARWVGAGARTTDALVSRTGLPVAGLLAALTFLEDRGLVRSAYGRYHLTGALVDLG
jgi:DNA processing protein